MHTLEGAGMPLILLVVLEVVSRRAVHLSKTISLFSRSILPPRGTILRKCWCWGERFIGPHPDASLSLIFLYMTVSFEVDIGEKVKH